MSSPSSSSPTSGTFQAGTVPGKPFPTASAFLSLISNPWLFSVHHREDLSLPFSSCHQQPELIQSLCLVLPAVDYERTSQQPSGNSYDSHSPPLPHPHPRMETLGSLQSPNHAVNTTHQCYQNNVTSRYGWIYQMWLRNKLIRDSLKGGFTDGSSNNNNVSSCSLHLCKVYCVPYLVLS